MAFINKYLAVRNFKMEKLLGPTKFDSKNIYLKN